MNRHVERVLDPSRKDTHGDAGRWRGIDDPLGYVHRWQWSGRSQHEMRLPTHCRREHHRGNQNDYEPTHHLCLRFLFFLRDHGNAALAEYNHLDGVGRYRAFNPPALF